MSEEMTQPQVDEEEVIMPEEDLDIEQEETTESPSEEVETEETPQSEESTETTEESTEEPIKIPIKFNHEEKEITIDEAKELAQKGMNYDKVQEQLNQLKSDPRLSFIEQQAKQYDMSVEDYMQAVKEQQQQAMINELVEKNVPEEYAREMIENRKFREQYKEEESKKQEESKKNAEYDEFFQYFSKVNDRQFDPNKDQIPPEVVEMNNNGVPLKFAYMQHHNNELQQQLKILKQNEQNKQKAPVSGTTEHGSKEESSKDPFEMGFDADLY